MWWHGKLVLASDRYLNARKLRLNCVNKVHKTKMRLYGSETEHMSALTLNKKMQVHTAISGNCSYLSGLFHIDGIKSIYHLQYEPTALAPLAFIGLVSACSALAQSWLAGRLLPCRFPTSSRRNLLRHGLGHFASSYPLRPYSLTFTRTRRRDPKLSPWLPPCQLNQHVRLLLYTQRHPRLFCLKCHWN